MNCIFFCTTPLTELPIMAPKKKSVGRSRDYKQSALYDAAFAVTDEGLTPYAAAVKHGVPKTTLISQMKGARPSDEQIQPAQRLSRAQEEDIVNWILRQEKLGYAPTSSLVRSLVTSILTENGDNRPLGKNWLASFKKRHPEVISKMGRKQEADRFTSFTPKAVN